MKISYKTTAIFRNYAIQELSEELNITSEDITEEMISKRLGEYSVEKLPQIFQLTKDLKASDSPDNILIKNLRQVIQEQKSNT